MTKPSLFMNTIFEIQTEIFRQIKEKLPANQSFVHEVSELLKVSYDSAYRRIRGEKELTFSELYELAVRYNLSVDTLFHVNSNNVVFRDHAINFEQYNLKDWLRTILANMKLIRLAQDKEIIYTAKDPPVFHYFQFPEIGAFKMFFWEKTLFNFPEFNEKQFSIHDYDPEVKELGEQILKYSVTMPTTEIWNEDTFNITLRQIEYYWVGGMFKNNDEVWTLLNAFELWLRHIQKQAELGFKFLFGTEPEGLPDSFKLYENEVVLNDNAILVKMDGMKVCFQTYNVASLLVTTDPKFTESVLKYFNSLITKSTLISSTGAKERSRFFNRLVDNINVFREKMK
jgi:hypothetical protein